MVAEQNKSILLVEEDPDVAMSMRLQLELNGFKVEMFTDPVSALEQYGQAPLTFDLVISDMKMTRMSAFEFMRAIKAQNPTSKILLITSFEVKPEEFSKVLPTSRVDGFLGRPSLHRQLIASVKKILDVERDSDCGFGLPSLGKP
ncbi:MAG TPA: response regulator [Candidatus Nitrosotalea sp.]|nr:response regulator [Candidatus Nitrosotalea sp.]